METAVAFLSFAVLVGIWVADAPLQAFPLTARRAARNASDERMRTAA